MYRRDRAVPTGGDESRIVTVRVGLDCCGRVWSPSATLDFDRGSADIVPCMYSTGMDPFTKKPVQAAKGLKDRKMQRAAPPTAGNGSPISNPPNRILWEWRLLGFLRAVMLARDCLLFEARGVPFLYRFSCGTNLLSPLMSSGVGGETAGIVSSACGKAIETKQGEGQPHELGLTAIAQVHQEAKPLRSR